MLSYEKKDYLNMQFIYPDKKNNDSVQLLGATKISDSSFFVYKNADGQIVLKSGNDECTHKKIVKYLIDINPKIKRLLTGFKIKPIIDTETLKNLLKGHMNETCTVAMGIYSFLPKELQSGVDREKIKEASILHDLGKVLIPSKILNKPSKLTFRERKIMNIHSTLGYELLKTQNVDSETLGLIKYHHQNLIKSGYPVVLQSQEPSPIGVQIISTADKYAALREARVYRKRLSKADALLILYKEVREGKISKEIYDALTEFVKTTTDI